MPLRVVGLLVTLAAIGWLVMASMSGMRAGTPTPSTTTSAGAPPATRAKQLLDRSQSELCRATCRDAERICVGAALGEPERLRACTEDTTRCERNCR